MVSSRSTSPRRRNETPSVEVRCFHDALHQGVIRIRDGKPGNEIDLHVSGEKVIKTQPEVLFPKSGLTLFDHQIEAISVPVQGAQNGLR